MKILLFEMLFYLYAHHPRVYVESIDKIFIIILDSYSNVSCTSKCYGPRNIFSDHQNFTKSQNLFELYIYNYESGFFLLWAQASWRIPKCCRNHLSNKTLELYCFETDNQNNSGLLSESSFHWYTRIIL